MKILVLAIVGLTALSRPATAQDTPQTQQMPKFKPGLNLMGDKQVDPRMEEYKKGCRSGVQRRTQKDTRTETAKDEK
jgi:hypothetical protein